ncbi:MAG: hypothetical protein AAB383_06280 [Patescibacteria group bacterium]
MEHWSQLIEESEDGELSIRGRGLREIVSILVGHEIAPGTTKDQLLTMMGGVKSLAELEQAVATHLKGKVACPEQVVSPFILDIRARINVTPERVQALFSKVLGYSAREVRLELERERAGDPSVGCLFHPMLDITDEERRALELKLINEGLPPEEATANCGILVVNQEDGGIVIQPFLNTPENLNKFKMRYPSSKRYFFQA